jgi:AcrR family transcriptional regulator
MRSLMPFKLRNEPAQSRSVVRVAQIESAARVVLYEDGRDAFTTARVAEVAMCSIGSIYRYFPDRVALLDRIWPDRDERITTQTGQIATIPVGETVTITGTIHRVESVPQDDTNTAFPRGGHVITLYVPDALDSE